MHWCESRFCAKIRLLSLSVALCGSKWLLIHLNAFRFHRLVETDRESHLCWSPSGTEHWNRNVPLHDAELSKVCITELRFIETKWIYEILCNAFKRQHLKSCQILMFVVLEFFFFFLFCKTPPQCLFYISKGCFKLFSCLSLGHFV